MADSKRILVVDDERLIADTLVLIMRLHGFEALACYDGRQAIAHAASFRPDLLISDYELPASNGIDIAVAITASHPSCLVVFLSALPAFVVSQKDGTVPDGFAYRWITKPVSPGVLLDQVQRTLHPQ